jgi:predicted dehydrogenase
LGRVGVGVIGCGSIGLWHLKRLKEMDRANVVAGCDVNPTALERFGAASGLPESCLYRDYGKLLEQDNVDAVVLGIPNKLHSIVAVDAFEAGKHVFCEKPMAVNLPEARRMVGAAERSGLKLQIGLQSRFKGDSQVIKRHVEGGELGEVYYARCGYLRRSGIPGWGSWFTRRNEAGAGPIFDIGVHVLDLTLWLMSNFRPATAYASSYSKFGPEKKGLGVWGTQESDGYFDVEDFATALLRMEDGASVSFEVSWASHIPKSGQYLTLMGERGGLDLETGTIYTTEDGGHIDKKLHFEDVDPYLAEMNHFIDCVLEDREPLTRPDEMLGLQKALDMILKSSQGNRLVAASEV